MWIWWLGVRRSQAGVGGGVDSGKLAGLLIFLIVNFILIFGVIFCFPKIEKKNISLPLITIYKMRSRFCEAMV